MPFSIRTCLSALLVAAASLNSLDACTNILVTKKASKDGSVMISYSADSHDLLGELYFRAGGTHLPGSMREIIEWDTHERLGQIPEAPLTYTRTGNMNEHQVVIGETTFGGRKELADGRSGLVDYGSLIYIALERSKTAREAIQVMTELVDKYGYASEGESFSIGDKNEAWILDMIGKGKGKKGAVWVAVRVPDGCISAHANKSRIATFNMKDKANCLFSPDVISFARENKWFDGKDEDFSFCDVYGGPDFGALRFCEARVWSIFRRANPSLNLPIDAVKGTKGAAPLPLFIKPEHPLSLQEVQALMRDHYEGTEFDMTKDVGAGPYKLPYRWRPMEWKLDGETYVHERAISTQQTGWSYVSQSRSWLPDPVGGVLWFGVDDTFTTVYFPVYCGVKAVPRSWAEGTGSFDEFSWGSAHWVFNFVTNWTYSRWSDMIQDVQKVQREEESRYIAELPGIDAQARRLLETQGADAARDFLTAYTCSTGDELTARWKKLGEFLLWKYMDGNVRNDKKKPTHPAYPEDWYRRIVKEKGDAIKEPKATEAH